MKTAKTLIFLILFGAGFLFGNYVLAATEVTGGCCDTTIIFNSPFPDQTYKPGDIINFSGSFRVTGCGDGLFFNKVTFYITEDKEIPIRDCAGRSTDLCGAEINQVCGLSPTYCYGATSGTYSQCEFRWYNQVKYLDTETIDPETGKSYNIYKLGETYPADVAEAAKPYWVEYNQSFIIPEDLGFSGPVRFYVQYSGTHWAGHWHWSITYQKGRINQPPEARDLSIREESYCFAPYPPVFLSWRFYDPDPEDVQSAYQIQIDDDSDFSSPAIDSGKVDSPLVLERYTYAPANLSFDTFYYWRVKVWDAQDDESQWAVHSFKTKLCYPAPDFDWLPFEPSLNEIVQFTDLSHSYEGAIIVSWSWKFENGDPATSTQQHPLTTFIDRGPNNQNNVTLTVTDENNNSCSVTKPVAVRPPLPWWREILPW